MTQMSTRRHLQELQWRLVIVAAFFITGATLAYAYQTQLVPLLLEPLGSQKLVYLNPAGGFSFIFLISIYAGLALALPVMIQQFYGFMRPALPLKARRKSSRIIVGSFILMIAGITFGYLVAVPNALHFLYSFADQYVEASLTADSYLSFVTAYTVGIGLVFQLPLLLLLLHVIKPMTPTGLMKSERWIVVVAFVVAAIITPTPDPINQTIIAVPVIFIYQIGVFLVLRSIYKERRKAKKAARTLRKAAPAATATLFHGTPVNAADFKTTVHATQASLAEQPVPTTYRTPALTAVKSQANPLLHTAPTPQPTQVKKTVRSMDGFSPGIRPAHLHNKRPQLVRTSQPTPVEQFNPAARTTYFGAPRFSIDGISPRVTLS